MTVLVSIILLGLLFSTLDNVNYFTSTNTYKYLLNAILIPVHQLPGVFNSNIYGSVVNGSLWTLPVEFICYIILFIVYRLYILDKKIFKYTIIPVTFVFVFVNISNVDIITVLSNYFEPLFMFYMGVILYVYKDIIYFGNKIFAISVIGFLLTVFFKMAWVGLFIFFPYILIYLSFGIKQISNSVDILGAISYGIYLCGFPIQQSIVYLNGGCMNSYMNFIIAAPLSILCGAIIYYISEKKLNEFVIKYK